MSNPFARRAIAALAVLCIAVALRSVHAPVAAAASAAAIEPGVLEAYRHSERATVWLVLHERADLSAAAQMHDWNARGRYVYTHLHDTAERSQRALRAELDARHLSYRAFWIVNAIRVTADRPTLEALAARSEVAQVLVPREYRIEPPRPSAARTGTLAPEWNLERIRAPAVWADFGTRGEGVVVANIDGGVQYRPSRARAPVSRQSRRRHFRSRLQLVRLVAGVPRTRPRALRQHRSRHPHHGHDGGRRRWRQPGRRRARRALDCGQGLRGQQLFGLRLAGRGTMDIGADDLAGTDPRPDLRPDVVNNSWGSNNGADLFYLATVQAWLASGIFPAFSNGNSGPACGTAGAPATYTETYSAGAFDSDDAIASFSSRGPSAATRGIKPNIAAPGVGIRSSVPHDEYAYYDGTSMASPHVAGTVALLISAAPALRGDIPQLEALLNASAIDATDTSCGGTATNNNTFGEGRLDAYAAVERAPRPPHGALAGTVKDAVTLRSIAGAALIAQGEATRETSADTAGAYAMTLPVGDYDVTASAFGYTPATTSVSIAASATTAQDLALAPLPAGTLAGIVRDDQGRYLRGARIEILNAPVAPVATDDDGAYAFPGLPAGSYDLRASVGGCNESAVQTLAISGDAALDFVLPALADHYGHTCRIVPMPYVDASTVLALDGDEASLEVPLPFPFPFYGTVYTRAFVTTNGYLTFIASDVTPYNSGLPNLGAPNAAIYAYWGDLVVHERASVRTQLAGTAPQRAFVIEWRNVLRAADPSSRITVELFLAERSGGVVAVYRGIDAPAEQGGAATLGIEYATGDDALQYTFDAPAIAGGKFGIAYYPPPFPGATAFAPAGVVDAARP